MQREERDTRDGTHRGHMHSEGLFGVCGMQTHRDMGGEGAAMARSATEKETESLLVGLHVLVVVVVVVVVVVQQIGYAGRQIVTFHLLEGWHQWC